MWSEKRYDLGFYIGQFVALVLIVGFLAILIVDMIAPIEVDRYSFGAEVIDKEAYHYNNRAMYLFYLRENDATLIEEVDEETFSKFDIGDWVEIEVTNYETRSFHREEQETKILGNIIED